VDGTAREISITPRWGFYEPRDSATLTTATGQPRRVWKRRQIESTVGPVTLREGRDKQAATDEFPDVTVQWLVRRHDGDWIVTVFLVNGQEEQRRERDRAWLFQPELVVAAPDGSPIFRRRPKLQAGGAIPRHGPWRCCTAVTSSSRWDTASVSMQSWPRHRPIGRSGARPPSFPWPTSPR
jgi:hypothetical protein